jgi:hypothetical protein
MLSLLPAGKVTHPWKDTKDQDTDSQDTISGPGVARTMWLANLYLDLPYVTLQL